ncbi:hypothetical protein M7I_6111 [Glarea lozoyensis 74030]|uniref:DUF4045 domain-containing protein n=1 Tax=Glarea lozoyensis (strain ATCC 74030 / MF5533) TaxID=1104152 RepID=H0ETP4_GLAL7|nr:hypothetical protein M7I_6111 [Glarea lozoyensis 74030]
MAEITKAKQKSSVDLGRPAVGVKHEVNIGGLMRSPPLGGVTKPLGVGSLASGVSPNLVKNRTGSVTSQVVKDAPAQRETNEEKPTTPAVRSPPTIAKAKPETPPKKDFRASLKPRQPPPNNSGTNEPEFKNVFGQLRRTTTQNYVAPDELKNNITRGKAALNVTGGPKKTERVDDFKEAILKKKDDFKKAQSEGKGVRPASGTIKNEVLPEALARRKTLVKSDEGPPKIDLQNNAPFRYVAVVKPSKFRLSAHGEHEYFCNRYTRGWATAHTYDQKSGSRPSKEGSNLRTECFNTGLCTN